MKTGHFHGYIFFFTARLKGCSIKDELGRIRIWEVGEVWFNWFVYLYIYSTCKQNIVLGQPSSVDAFGTRRCLGCSLSTRHSQHLPAWILGYCLAYLQPSCCPLKQTHVAKEQLAFQLGGKGTNRLLFHNKNCTELQMHSPLSCSTKCSYTENIRIAVVGRSSEIIEFSLSVYGYVQNGWIKELFCYWGLEVKFSLWKTRDHCGKLYQDKKSANRHVLLYLSVPFIICSKHSFLLE